MTVKNPRRLHLTTLNSATAPHPPAAFQTCFNPQGTRILTASSDKVARLWDADTGNCLQLLEGHTDEIFSCAFNYEGDTIITGKRSRQNRKTEQMTPSIRS